MKTAVVRLEKHDDFISARDKITWSQAKRVLLLWPESTPALGSRLDLTLLVRMCEERDLQMAFIGARGAVKAQAQELGIPVFRNVKTANRKAWRKPHRSLRLASAPRPTENRRARLEELRAAFTEQPREFTFWQRLGIFSLGVVSVLALVLLFLPGAEVSLSPRQQVQSLNLTLMASPSTSSPTLAGALPAQMISVEVEGQNQANSTAQASFPDQPATGKVEFKNLTDQVITIPKGTVVTTLGEPVLEYETTQSGLLESGREAVLNLPVVARQPGSQGNVESGAVSVLHGQLGPSVSVTNPRAFSGGSDRRALVPGASDYQKAEDTLLESLQETALKELESQVGASDWLLPETLQVLAIVDEKRDPAPGQPADRFTLSMRVEFSAWVVSRQHVEAIANLGFAANQPAGYDVVPGSFEIEPAGPVTINGQTAKIPVQVTRQLTARWSDAALAQALTGVQLETASKVIERQVALQGPAEVRVTPNWWQLMPFLPFRIQVAAQ